MLCVHARPRCLNVAKETLPVQLATWHDFATVHHYACASRGNMQVTAAISFVNTVGTRLDDAILSLGWTTVAHPSNGVHAYTSGMIEDMQAVVQELAECSVAFTFAVRATYVRSSWVGLQTLLKYPLTSLTVWAHEQPTAGDLAWMESAIPSTKVMFDLGAPTADWFWDRVAVYALAAAFIGGCWLHTR